MSTMKQRAEEFAKKASGKTAYQDDLVEFADAECRRTWEECRKECAAQWKAQCEKYTSVWWMKDLEDVILNTPYPVENPLSPFGCGCWKICNGHYEHETTSGAVVLNIKQVACQWCGAARIGGGK